MTLRQLLWRYHGITYQQLMTACSVTAGIFNSQRTKTSDRVFMFTDFHPAHLALARKAKKTGKQVLQGIACWFGNNIKWAAGFGPDKI